jgi:hypothetical protein
LPDFSRYKIPKREKYTKLPQNIPNVNKIYQKSVKWTKCPKNIPTSSIARPSKIYPNLDFWFENKPSGNPGIVAGAEQPQIIGFFISNLARVHCMDAV